MNPIAATYPVRELQRNYRTLIQKAKDTQDAVVLTKDGTPDAVLLDVATYHSLLRDDYVYDEKKLLKLVKAAEKSFAEGKAKRLVSWDDLDA